MGVVSYMVVEDEPRISVPYLTALLTGKSRLPTPKASNTTVKGDDAAESGKGISKVGLYALLMREQGKTAAQEGSVSIKGNARSRARRF